LRESEARVRYLAYYDPLTALPNRQRLLQILEQQLAWAMPRQRGLAVLMLDRRQFFAHHDTQGQAVGDVLLKEIAHRLQIACAIRSARRIKGRTPSHEMTSTTGWRAPAAMNSRWRCRECPQPMPRNSWRSACSWHWRGRSSSRKRRYRCRRRWASAYTRATPPPPRRS